MNLGLSTSLQSLILPANYRDIRQCWMLLFQEGREGKPPEFFLSHAINFPKFDTEDRRRSGIKIVGHLRSRQDAVLVCKELNDKIKKRKKRISYQNSSSRGPVKIKPSQPKLFIPKDFKNG